MSIPDFRKLLGATTDRAVRYLEGLEARPVAASEDSIEATRGFDVPLQDEPIEPERVVKQLDEIGSPATTAMAGPRYFGYVVGGSLPAALAANWLATAWDQKTAFASAAPATTALEQVALKWILDVLGLPVGCAGAFVTGTTVAHITALAAARHAVLEKAGWDVEANGLFGAPPITVVTGAEAHPSLYKALGIVGLGRNRVVQVPADGQGRMRADSLPRISGPTIVCVQAGNVNTGAFDPIHQIAPPAREAGAWVHVDGAFGLWARVTPRFAHLAAGIELADSWATDAHKWLNVPYDSGIALVRNADALRRAMAVSAEYLPVAVANPSDYTPEFSRRARGVDIWAAMRSLGRSGLAELVERNCRQARRFAEGLSAAGFEILNDVILNQVLVSFGEPNETRRVIGAIQREGTLWAGDTVWHGLTAMRISVSSWATTDSDIDRSIAAIIRIARAPAGEGDALTEVPAAHDHRTRR